MFGAVENQDTIVVEAGGWGFELARLVDVNDFHRFVCLPSEARVAAQASY